MPANCFICPEGRKIPIAQCLHHCPRKERCLFLPTLRVAAGSLNRNLKKATVTELLCGTREMYLRKTEEYAVDPMQQIYALHGSAVHAIQEGQSYGEILSEERLYDRITSGQFDLYGRILTDRSNVLGDYKVTSSYKLMKALGYYTVSVPTGECYKTGLKKGQAKTRKEWRTDGVRQIFEWAVQINYYRMLLEEQGFQVGRMEIQAMCRDYGLRIASERNIRKPVYVIHINKISNHWLDLYMKTKAERLERAIRDKKMPPACSMRECWNGRKCRDYCVVAESCPCGRAARENEKAV